jgi:hypothetical protein
MFVILHQIIRTENPIRKKKLLYLKSSIKRYRDFKEEIFFNRRLCLIFLLYKRLQNQKLACSKPKIE